MEISDCMSRNPVPITPELEDKTSSPEAVKHDYEMLLMELETTHDDKEGKFHGLYEFSIAGARLQEGREQSDANSQTMQQVSQENLKEDAVLVLRVFWLTPVTSLFLTPEFQNWNALLAQEWVGGQWCPHLNFISS